MSEKTGPESREVISIGRQGEGVPALPARQGGGVVSRQPVGVFGQVGRSAPRSPLVDIHQTPEGLVLEADVPGASEKTLTIQLEHNVLHLRASADLDLPEDARLIQQEHPIGDFERTFILSDEVDRANIAAELKHGELRVFLPRAERGLTRRIEIKGD